jgi:signal peptidase I
VRADRLVIALGLLGATGWMVGRCGRVEVVGVSMAPTLLDGDRLVVVPVGRLRLGDLVVLPDPRTRSRPLVKRLAAVPNGRVVVGDVVLEAGMDEVIVLGDNPAASTDSRTIGPVAVSSIVGRAAYRYHPPDRAGPLRRGAGWRAAGDRSPRAAR